jgi:hypothetical protein
MAAALPGVPFSTKGDVWLPDLAAFLWAELSRGPTPRWRNAWSDGHGPPRTEEQTALFLAAEGIGWRRAFRDAGGWAPPAVLDDLARALAATAADGTPALLRLLVALDRACEGLSLVEPRDTASTEAIRDYWWSRADGNLARFGTVQVLRKATKVPSSGAALSYYLKNFTILDGAGVSTYEVAAVPLAESTRLSSRPGAPSRELTLAFVPVLDDSTDATFHPVNRASSMRFALELNAAKQARFRDEAPDLVRRLEGAGVELALLPETCLDEASVDALRLALVSNFAERKGTPNLRLVLAGRLRPRENAVVALSGSGQTLLVQHKQRPWTLDAFQQSRYGLANAFLHETQVVERTEDIELSQPPSIWALDDPGFGRLVILICEDLARCDPARGVAVALGPTHVVSPVMDASLASGRWACAAAAALVDEPGARVFVVNSLFLSALAVRGAGTGSSTIDGGGVGHVAHPDYKVREKLPPIFSQRFMTSFEFQMVKFPV